MTEEAGDDVQQTDDAGSCYGPTLVDSSVETELTPPPRRDSEPRFVAVVTECRANPVVSRRGYLLVTDGKEADEATPVKRWVVSYRSLSKPRIILYTMKRLNTDRQTA